MDISFFPITDPDPKRNLPIKSTEFELKNTYEKYQNRTNGNPVRCDMFQDITSVTKSKYENVIGWVRPRK